MTELKIRQAPTFVFYKEGKEIDRHVGSSRGDLMGYILKLAQNYKVELPKPKAPALKRRAPARK